jgi:hypothetical protein
MSCGPIQPAESAHDQPIATQQFINGQSMRLLYNLAILIVIAIAPVPSAYAALKCPFISDQQLAAETLERWSLVSNQDGRGCIYTGEHNDTLMLVVFRNPTAERAKELYATFVKTLGERMTVSPVSGLGDDAQGGATTGNPARPEAAVVTLSGDYILQINLYRSGQPVDEMLVKPLTALARHAIGNVTATSEKFGGCEWLSVDDAVGFLDRDTLTIQRTGTNSCMMFDSTANTMLVAVVSMSRDTQVNMRSHNGGCRNVALPELGKDAFGEVSCTSGNTNRVSIYLWKNGRQAEIVFAPTKQHPESGSVERLKAVAGRVLQKM